MAAAEARAAWQRTANRCFVQEDAKRAPKLACCPSSSSSSKQSDTGPTGSSGGPDHPTSNFMPHNKHPSNIPSDSKWWLQLQPKPNYGFQKGLTHDEIETSKVSGTPPPSENWSVQKNEEDEFLKPSDVKKYYESKELDGFSCDFDSPWMKCEKSEPWWRRADGDELASLVAKKSLEHVENCDLPRPQNIHVRSDPFACIGNLDHNGIFSSNWDWKAQAQAGGFHAWGSQASGKLYAKQSCVPEVKSDKQFSYSATQKEIADTDPSKAELLEALRHSQTRAREAEKAAKQAYAEKEHIIKLFFRQASQLFAYKQWFQLHQLESLYLNIKNKDQPITLFPHKPRKLRKNSRKARPTKRGLPRYDIARCAVAFALGLSLVGAGLLLGWTIGWMLPTF